MKKKILLLFSMLAIVASVFIIKTSINRGDDVFNANLEALSATELFNTDCFLWVEEHVLGSGLPLVFVIDCEDCKLKCIDYVQGPARCHS